MLVRATAIATERSNAIGTVELQCTPHGLAMVYLGVGAFSEGYAPGALTMGTRVTVPWSEVLEARVEGDQLFLSVEPARTPHHRITLVNFSTGDTTHPRQDSRQRLVIWIGAVGAAVVATLVSALTVPRIAPQAGATAALTIGGLSALAILAVGFLADRRVGGAGLSDDAACEAFAAELAHYLPTLIRLPQAPQPTPKPLVLPDLAGFLPRTTAAIAITLTAGLLGVVLTARWLLSNEGDGRRVAALADPARESGPMLEPQAPVESEPAAAPSPPPPTRKPAASEPNKPAEAAGPQAAAGGHCSCARADSVLWRDPIPKLSVLVLDKKLIDGPTRKHLELNIAAVNNGAGDLRDLSMMVSFIEQDPPPSNRRTAVAHRAVFYEGPLGPGQAIKWNVEARGSDFEVDTPIEGDIGPGGDRAAATNMLADLLNANHRPVRLHGAMMLAYLGDPRARDAVVKLKEALREDEAPYLDRLLRALGEVRACEFRVTGSGGQRDVEACVFNAGKEPREQLGIKVRALDSKVSHSEPTAPPPKVIAEASWKIPGTLAPEAGVRTRAKLQLPASIGEPAMFEIFADRDDLLP